MHIVSLIIAYAATIYALWLLLKVSKQCTTTPLADLPVKTEPSHSGQTNPISIPQYSGFFDPGVRELQEDTEFLSNHSSSVRYGRLSQEDSDER